MTMYSVKDSWNLPYGYGVYAAVNCVKGTGENQAQTKWRDIPYICRTNAADHWKSITNYQWNVVACSSTSISSSKIYPDLQIKNGEYKLLIECHLWQQRDTCFANGISSRNVSRRELFGFLFLTPHGGNSFRAWDSANQNSYFSSVTIFRAIDGSVNDTAPQ